jgi:hypothetical protein
LMSTITPIHTYYNRQRLSYLQYVGHHQSFQGTYNPIA